MSYQDITKGMSGIEGLAATDVFNTGRFETCACGTPRARRVDLRDATD
jgi:hypothetical protein